MLIEIIKSSGGQAVIVTCVYCDMERSISRKTEIESIVEFMQIHAHCEVHHCDCGRRLRPSDYRRGNCENCKEVVEDIIDDRCS